MTACTAQAHGHAGEHREPDEPQPLRNPHRRLQRRRGAAVEQQALVEHVPALPHRDRRKAEQQHRGGEVEHRDHERRHAREQEIDPRMRLLQQRRGEAEGADDRQQIGAELGHALHRMAEQPARHDVVERRKADRHQRPAARDLHPAHRRPDPAGDGIAIVIHATAPRYGIVRLRDLADGAVPGLLAVRIGALAARRPFGQHQLLRDLAHALEVGGRDRRQASWCI